MKKILFVLASLCMSLVLAACATTDGSSAVSVQLSSETISVTLNQGTHQVNFVNHDSGRQPPDASSSFAYNASTLPAIRMTTVGTESNIYGVAPKGTAKVVVSFNMFTATMQPCPEISANPLTSVGQDATFVAVIPKSANRPPNQTDTPPECFHWSFFDASGTLLAEGNGLH